MNLRLLPLLAVGLLAACTDPVKDIDRTQGNLIRKADLEGEWYMLETIAGVPPTSWFTFIGETSKMERVKFVVQESLLVAYRSYPLVPGADSPSAGEAFDGTDNPVAAWPIVAHVDVRRDYNASTGEQSNVIIEDTGDRLWHERDYIRVDWTQNRVANFDFIAPTTEETSLGYFVTEEQGGEDAFYREEKDGALSYIRRPGEALRAAGRVGLLLRALRLVARGLLLGRDHRALQLRAGAGHHLRAVPLRRPPDEPLRLLPQRALHLRRAARRAGVQPPVPHPAP
ncbi:MAG: hypothetical protein R3F43_29060 [bacterium]